ncbi:glycosyltransferase [Rufibacter roseolus]|uniref:glycosyltransferase n=1 Tax=Rufibacter roseolus TaxID=2817375 RepID=UPI001B301531|nr:glycosyltransferase [Rufibacter roseolus]
MYTFKEVTLLITHYNRSSSLERLLKSFRSNNCVFGGVVVSDDASKPEHLAKLYELREEFKFNLITTPVNKGLGNNINKGQDAVTTPYTLYVQEDFEPQKGFFRKLQESLEIMEEDKGLDIIRYYSYLLYPYLKPYGNGFSEMYIFPFAPQYKKVYFYSDHPHLRRSTFLEKFGRYKEVGSIDKCEYAMCVSFIRKKGRGLFYNDYQSLFVQNNTAQEPSTLIRSDWTKSKNPLIVLARDVYRQVKYNFDLHLAR